MEFFKTLMQPDVLKVLAQIGIAVIFIFGLIALLSRRDDDDIDDILNY
jgi:hypothetical protein